MLDKRFIERIKRPIEPDKYIAPGIVPILYTGNYAKAEVCTISLNPLEFYRGKGKTLLKNHKISRDKFAKGDTESLDDKDVQKILDYCDNYPGIGNAFFKKQDLILKQFGEYSYQDGTAVLLDLVQWETAGRWGGLPEEIQHYHLDKDAETFSALLQQKKFNYIFLNGPDVIEEIQKRFVDLHLDKFDNIMQTSQNITIPKGQNINGYFGKWRNATVVGWSRFFGRSLPRGWTNQLFDNFPKKLHRKYTEWYKK